MYLKMDEYMPSERVGRALLSVRDCFVSLIIDAFNYLHPKDFNRQIVDSIQNSTLLESTDIHAMNFDVFLQRPFQETSRYMNTKMIIMIMKIPKVFTVVEEYLSQNPSALPRLTRRDLNLLERINDQHKSELFLGDCRSITVDRSHVNIGIIYAQYAILHCFDVLSRINCETDAYKVLLFNREFLSDVREEPSEETLADTPFLYFVKKNKPVSTIFETLMDLVSSSRASVEEELYVAATYSSTVNSKPIPKIRFCALHERAMFILKNINLPEPQKSTQA